MMWTEDLRPAPGAARLLLSGADLWGDARCSSADSNTTLDVMKPQVEAVVTGSAAVDTCPVSSVPHQVPEGPVLLLLFFLLDVSNLEELSALLE